MPIIRIEERKDTVYNRFDHSEEISDYLPLMIDGLDIHEYGTCSGSTLQRALNVFKTNNKAFNRVFAYDSWLGLPDTKHEEWFNRDWDVGSFCALKEFNVKTIEELLPLLREKIGHDVTFISGWYKDTLNKITVDKYKLKQAMYVNIDVDIYSSTKQVLDFCLDYGIIAPGTVFRYDDWMSCGTSEGNQRAHYEMLEKRNVVVERLSLNVFRLVG